MRIVWSLACVALGVLQSRPARTFLDTLDDAQRSRVRIGLDDAARKDWHYVPRDRPGVRLGELDAGQTKAFRALLDATLSEAGARAVDGVIRLESVLRELESSPARDPGRYAIAIFGEPGKDEPWGWRLEGHHLSLNLCVAGGRVAVTPFFLGAHPREVAAGPDAGLRVLGEEEDLALELVRSLDEGQRAKAVREKDVPADVILRPGRAASFLEPAGIGGSELDPAQRERLARIVAVFVGRLRADLRGMALEHARETSAADLRFLWIGPTKPRQAFYWRVQGKGFAIEFDSVQDDGNHVHEVWRDLDDDFGEDLLRRHREEHHGGK